MEINFLSSSIEFVNYFARIQPQVKVMNSLESLIFSSPALVKPNRKMKTSGESAKKKRKLPNNTKRYYQITFDDLKP